MNPNKKQKEIIENTEGIYLVDAGPGTGKTFTVTQRYQEILSKKGISPEDIFLATFTNNAADEMSERIIQEVDVKSSKIYDAPISTFHSYSKNLLELYGYSTPQKIGIDEYITEDLNTVESHLREIQHFNRFYDQFREDNPEYHEYYVVISNSSELLQLLKNLASKGIIPEEDGWFANSEKYLDGDYEKFKQIFNEKNKPINTEQGFKKQSELRRKTYTLKWKNFSEDAPEIEDIRGGRGSKKIRGDLAGKAFKEDREELKSFIHDLYYSYLDYCLQNNYLNFNFLLIFAYILLHENKAVREDEGFNYIMIDEFQDTNEIQLKIALLLANKPNICAVGDWKQSIYSFQHASIENILEFESRAKKYKNILNKDEERVSIDLNDFKRINLEINYRSTQDIIETAKKSFDLPANQYESIEKPDIEDYIAGKDKPESNIERIESDEEKEKILAKIQEIVGNPDYALENGEEPTYDDIAILTRTRRFGVKLQEKAEKYNIPASYEGGIELFRTDPAVILLAWLRIVSQNSAKGWAVVLENAGYNIKEVRDMLDDDEDLEIPEKFIEFREDLRNRSSIAGFVRTVFDRYGFSGAIPDKIIQVLRDVFVSSYFNKRDIIEFVEENIDQGEIYEIDNTVRQDSINIMTIHSSKGLEFPVVFISDINQGKFPSTNSYSMAVDFESPIGIRQRKKLVDNGDSSAYIFDNWRSELLFKTLSGEYDEERRLMFVAMTRAEDHLVFTADRERKSTFFTNLDVEKAGFDKDPEVLDEDIMSRNIFEI